jgi:hypothetical protein
MAQMMRAIGVSQWEWTKGNDDVNRSGTLKSSLSTDCSLKLMNMKKEPVVIDNQNVSVNENLSIGLTARQRLRSLWIGNDGLNPR